MEPAGSPVGKDGWALMNRLDAALGYNDQDAKGPRNYHPPVGGSPKRRFFENGAELEPGSPQARSAAAFLAEPASAFNNKVNGGNEYLAPPSKMPSPTGYA